MRGRVVVLILLNLTIVLASCTMWREHPAKNWKDITGGESMERAFWQAVKSKDWSGIDQHFASTYVLVIPEGTLDRAAALEHWKQLEIQDYSLGNFNVQLSGNAYVVSYTLVVKGTLAGRPLPATPMQAMTVWQQQRREWLAIAQALGSGL